MFHSPLLRKVYGILNLKHGCIFFTTFFTIFWGKKEIWTSKGYFFRSFLILFTQKFIYFLLKMIYFPKLGEYNSEKILRSAPVYILNGEGEGGGTIFRKNIHP